MPFLLLSRSSLRFVRRSINPIKEFDVASRKNMIGGLRATEGISPRSAAPLKTQERLSKAQRWREDC